MNKLVPIGYIRTQYKDQGEIPRQPREDERGHYLEIAEEFLPALTGLDKFNFIYLLYYLDRLEGGVKLTLAKGGIAEEVGLFATRTPQRPNPIGLSVVQLLKIRGNRVYISGIDALDRTPLLDIKPYFKGLDLKEEANSGWVDEEAGGKMIYLYTDGACSGNPGPGGYAAIVKDGNNELEISGYEPETTNNRMELMAVIEGLKEISPNSEVKVFSDSNYVLRGLSEWMKQWKRKGWKTASNRPVKNRDLWEELDILTKDYDLEFVKIKGHSGHHYNELVDTMAREQIENNNK